MAASPVLEPKKHFSFVNKKAILVVGFVAGTLDIIAAITVQSLKAGKNSTEPVLKYIASGYFGKDAFAEGIEMLFAGLLIHYLLAFAFTILYFLLFPYITFFRKHKIISGLLYGIFIWFIMNRIVLPMTNTPPIPFNWESAFTGIAILMVCMGLPVSLLMHQYSERSANRSL